MLHLTGDGGEDEKGQAGGKINRSPGGRRRPTARARQGLGDRDASPGAADCVLDLTGDDREDEKDRAAGTAGGGARDDGGEPSSSEAGRGVPSRDAVTSGGSESDGKFAGGEADGERELPSNGADLEVSRYQNYRFAASAMTA